MLTHLRRKQKAERYTYQWLTAYHQLLPYNRVASSDEVSVTITNAPSSVNIGQKSFWTHADGVGFRQVGDVAKIVIGPQNTALSIFGQYDQVHRKNHHIQRIVVIPVLAADQEGIVVREQVSWLKSTLALVESIPKSLEFSLDFLRKLQK